MQQSLWSIVNQDGENEKVCSLVLGKRIFPADRLKDVSMEVPVNMPELQGDIRGRPWRERGEMLMCWGPVRALLNLLWHWKPKNRGLEEELLKKEVWSLRNFSALTLLHLRLQHHTIKTSSVCRVSTSTPLHFYNLMKLLIKKCSFFLFKTQILLLWEYIVIPQLNFCYSKTCLFVAFSLNLQACTPPPPLQGCSSAGVPSYESAFEKGVSLCNRCMKMLAQGSDSGFLWSAWKRSWL